MTINQLSELEIQALGEYEYNCLRNDPNISQLYICARIEEAMGVQYEQKKEFEKAVDTYFESLKLFDSGGLDRVCLRIARRLGISELIAGYEREVRFHMKFSVIYLGNVGVIDKYINRYSTFQLKSIAKKNLINGVTNRTNNGRPN